MNQSVFRFFKNYGHEPTKVDRLIVSTFVFINKYKIKNNRLILKYTITEQDHDYHHLLKFINLFSKNGKPNLSFEELIELFEFVISPVDKEVNGAVYTPKYIRKYILSEVLEKYKNDDGNLSTLRIADIACGCGGFLFDVARILKKRTGKSYYKIFKENLFGLDIQKYSIDRTELLLSLLAINDGEDKKDFIFNIHHGNALNFNWGQADTRIAKSKFDIIVGNPPYVGAPKIDSESLQLLNGWSVTKSGKADLYIPFFQIALENLHEKGILGYITVNTFYKSVNGRALRKYFSKNQFGIEIIDFSGEKVFKGRSTYTCICIIEKRVSSIIKYIKRPSDSLQAISKSDFYKIQYSSLDDFDGWLLESNSAIDNINKIQRMGSPLGEKFLIRNGFATLRNDIYVFSPIKEDSKYFNFILNNVEYNIEKKICVNVIKPNILKNENDIITYMEKLIFPYIIRPKAQGVLSDNLQILDEICMRKRYPMAYKYLLAQKDELSKRDKEKRDYPTWYAFGRNQALTISGYKLLFPYIAEKPYFVFTDDQDLLFYNGYAIISNSQYDLLILQKILKSKIFWYYLSHSSKPYGNGYFSFGKNYIKRFGICELDEAEKSLLLNETDESIIDSFLLRKYDLKI